MVEEHRNVLCSFACSVGLEHLSTWLHSLDGRPTVGIQLTYFLVYSFLLAGIRFDSYGIDQMLRSLTQGET